MRISDWSSDVCSSDLLHQQGGGRDALAHRAAGRRADPRDVGRHLSRRRASHVTDALEGSRPAAELPDSGCRRSGRSEEHTSELQSLMSISYAVFCLKKKNKKTNNTNKYSIKNEEQQ